MAKKVSKKKIPKKRKKKSDPKKKELRKKAEKKIGTRKIINLSLTVLLILVISLTGFMIYINSMEITEDTPAIIQKIVNLNNQIFQKPSELAAVVNEQEITLSEVEERYKLLPAEYQAFVSEQDVLLQIIDETLLLQEAENQGIVVSDEDVDNRINSLLLENQVTMAQLEETLAERDLSVEDLKEFYKKEMIINEVLDETVFNNISISDTDIKDFYYTNKEQFKIPETRNISHILICHNESLRCVANRSKEEALEEALDVKLMINKTNFNDIAVQYSDEPISSETKGKLGLITKETSFDETFLNATFSLNEGQVSLPIETVFGYHLINVHEVILEDYISLEGIYQQINQTLIAERQQITYTEHINGLRKSSNIVNFLEQEE